MPQRALVTGATGLLGRQVVDAFETAGWEVTGTGYSRAAPPKTLKLDIQNEDELKQVLDQVKPHVVIHCAANRFPDFCTSNPEAALALNSTATGNLARLTSASSILLIYISTDYVFPGTRGQAPYASDATPSPPNIYGQTKLGGEEEVLKHTKDTGLGVVLRVPLLYGRVEPEGNNKESAVNVLMDVLWKSQDLIGTGKQKIKMDHWALRYPTNTADVARVIRDISTQYLAAYTQVKSPLPTILQFSSEDKYTKYEICQVFAEVMGLSTDGFEADDDGGPPVADSAGTATMRPYDCHLSTQALRDLGIDLQTMDFVGWWRREVRAFRH